MELTRMLSEAYLLIMLSCGNSKVDLTSRSARSAHSWQWSSYFTWPSSIYPVSSKHSVQIVFLSWSVLIARPDSLAVIDKTSNELFLLLLMSRPLINNRLLTLQGWPFVPKKRLNSPRVSMLKTRFEWILTALLSFWSIGQARDVGFFWYVVTWSQNRIHTIANFKVLFTETGHNNAFVIVLKAAINTVDVSALKLSVNSLSYSIGAGLFCCHCL